MLLRLQKRQVEFCSARNLKWLLLITIRSKYSLISSFGGQAVYTLNEACSVWRKRTKTYGNRKLQDGPPAAIFIFFLTNNPIIKCDVISEKFGAWNPLLDLQLQL